MLKCDINMLQMTLPQYDDWQLPHLTVTVTYAWDSGAMILSWSRHLMLSKQASKQASKSSFASILWVGWCGLDCWNIRARAHYVTHAVKTKLFCALGQNWVLIKVYILPFVMVVKYFKSDNPERSYTHLNFEVLKSIWSSEIGFQSCQLGQK